MGIKCGLFEGVYFSSREIFYDDNGDVVEKQRFVERIANFCEELISGSFTYIVESEAFDLSHKEIVLLAERKGEQPLPHPMLSQAARVALLCTGILPALALLYTLLYRHWNMPVESTASKELEIEVPLENLSEDEKLNLSLRDIKKRSLDDQKALAKFIKRRESSSREEPSLPRDLLDLTLRQLAGITPPKIPTGASADEAFLAKHAYMLQVGRLRALPLRFWSFFRVDQIAYFSPTFSSSDPERDQKLIFLMSHRKWLVSSHIDSLILEFCKEDASTLRDTLHMLENIEDDFLKWLFFVESTQELREELVQRAEQYGVRCSVAQPSSETCRLVMHFLFNEQLVLTEQKFCKSTLKWIYGVLHQDGRTEEKENEAVIFLRREEAFEASIPPQVLEWWKEVKTAQATEPEQEEA